MAKTATATRARKAKVAEPAEPAEPVIQQLTIETNEALAKMPAKYAECYGAFHPFKVRTCEFVETPTGKLRQVYVYLRCPTCTMDATDLFDVEQTPSGNHVLRRAALRGYDRPEDYGIQGQGRIDHDVIVTNRLLARSPDIAAYFTRPI